MSSENMIAALKAGKSFLGEVALNAGLLAVTNGVAKKVLNFCGIHNVVKLGYPAVLLAGLANGLIIATADKISKHVPFVNQYTNGGIGKLGLRAGLLALGAFGASLSGRVNFLTAAAIAGVDLITKYGIDMLKRSSRSKGQDDQESVQEM
jgi:hypothetical protein